MSRRIFLLILSGYLFWLPATASALPLEEVFYGGKEDNLYKEIREGDKLKLKFDLTRLNTNSPAPTSDATRYDPETELISNAFLDFTFSSADLWPELVKIKTGFYDGDVLIAEELYFLGRLTWTKCFQFDLVREYADLHIDLLGAGLLPYLQDGRFDTIILAPEICLIDNDFRLDRASLTAEADLKEIPPAPVPEPATLLLFGSSLIGTAVVSRRKRQ
jgi:hypothetical protein